MLRNKDIFGIWNPTTRQNACFLAIGLFLFLASPDIVLGGSKLVNTANNINPAEQPTVAPLASLPSFVYLSQVSRAGFGGSAKLILFFALVALWGGVIVYIIKFVDYKKFFKRAFRNVEDEPQFAEANASGGFVHDINNNSILTMDMKPIGAPQANIAVPKYGAEHLPVSNAGDMSAVYAPTAKDYSMGNGSVVPSANNNGNHSRGENVASNGNDNLKQNGKFDLTTDVNSFVNLIVRGDEKPVLEFIKKIKDKGATAGDFAANVVLELDNVYRAKMAGETNRRNIVLSQIVFHWNGAKIEAVMNGLLAIVENSYTDNNLGTKIALMRIMRS